MSEDNVLNAKVQIDKDTVVFAMKDMDFLKDEAKTESEIAAAQEELDNINHKIEKIEDRRKVVFGDYCYAINNKMQRFEKASDDLRRLTENMSQSRENHEKLKAEEELKKQQELGEQQESKDLEEEDQDSEQQGEDDPESENPEQKDSKPEESGETDGQNNKKEDENGGEESGDSQKDTPSGITNQGQKDNISHMDEEAHEVTSPQTEGQEDISEETDAEDEETADTGEKDEGESIDGMEDMENTPEDLDAEKEPLPSNEPVYEVEIPSQVKLTDDTDSFTIQTKKLIPEEDGELVVTVEGTESRDRKNFALYCGENSWEYRLEIAGNLITPEENQAILDGWSEAQDVNILPENNIDLCPGEYSGVLVFHVVYESRVENYEMEIN